MNPAQDIPSAVEPWQAGVWVVLTVWMFFSWWMLFARRLETESTVAERLLAAFICWICQILGTTLILGSINRLYWWELGILNAVIALAVSISGDLFSRRGNLVAEIKRIVGILKKSFGGHGEVLSIAVIAAVIVIWITVAGMILPPWGWGPWWVNLPWAAFAHQEGNLGPFLQPVPWINTYPMNAETVFLWWIIGTGSDRLACAGQLPFAIAGAVAVYAIARNLGARRIDAALGACLVFSAPVIFQQMWIAKNDVAVMAVTLIAVAFLTRGELTIWSMIIAGCAAGYSVGTKGPYYLVGLIVVLIVRPFLDRTVSARLDGRSETAEKSRCRQIMPPCSPPQGGDGVSSIQSETLYPCGYQLRTSPPLRGDLVRAFPSNSPLRQPQISHILAFLAPCLIFGSYWYFRNWVDYGNPLGIFMVRIGSWVIFPGEDPMQALFHPRTWPLELYESLKRGPVLPIILRGFFDPDPVSYGMNRIGGWGPVFTTLLLPSVPIALGLGICRRKWMPVLVAIALIIPFFMYEPVQRTMARYHLQLIGLGCVCFALLLTWLENRRSRGILIWFVAISVGVTFFLSGLPAYVEFVNPQILSQAAKNGGRESTRYAYFETGLNDREFLTALGEAESPGTTIAFTHVPPNDKTLALWNPDYTNRVVFVKWEGGGEEWEKSLVESGADTVYVGPHSAPLEWAMDHPGEFERMYVGGCGGIFRVIREGGVE